MFCSQFNDLALIKGLQQTSGVQATTAVKVSCTISGRNSLPGVGLRTGSTWCWEPYVLGSCGGGLESQFSLELYSKMQGNSSPQSQKDLALVGGFERKNKFWEE